MGPSDHASFYLKDIPVLHFYTGTHYDYHKPSDDANKINAQGEVAVIDFVASIAKQIAKYPEKLTFRQTKNNTSTGTSTFKVTLGVIPDYAFDGDGLRLDGVSEGKPASKAGLKTGDIIIKMGPLAIHNIQDYMKGLGMFSKGEMVTINILRGKEQLNIAVTF
jgi:S1-C subfamily serine protease